MKDTLDTLPKSYYYTAQTLSQTPMSKPKSKPYNPFTVDSTETARQALLVRRAELKEEIESLPPGPCAFCGQTIPADKRPDSKYCSASCRVDASLQRGLKINHATFMAANQRAAKSEICALRLRARAEYLRKLVVADSPQTSPATTQAPPVSVSSPAPVALPKVWKPSPAPEKCTGKLSLSDLDEMTADEIPYACEYDSNPSVRAFAPLLRAAAKADTDTTSLVDNLRDYLRNIDDADDADESEDTFEADRLATESADNQTATE